ncbi:unnamed protein product [Parascedosporium putredinis]|uniref:Major facilitator superfamily (MFS) profile domain-containing protein n=1 Tax=Parascedosporium putredinis TaxID=1442378 RepID=A0A9P1MA64_9PEZI|nr:unnamed protein product [Parascedosporium putredinis]CAI7992187.1 unnamed protein product [Parascedosporium putredinis]
MASPCGPSPDFRKDVEAVKASPPTQPEGRAAQSTAEEPRETEAETPFSIYTTRERKWIAFIASFGAMFSTLSSYIYFPALVPMAADLGVSITLINLTVTSYLIVAGIAPAFMGDIADQGGRRPAYILMFSLVVGSNVGLALQSSYPVLFVLRMVQSAGASGSYGAAYGVLADITTVAERGSYVGSLIVLTNAAPSFGPVIAGVLTQKLGWRWIFWFLVILTGTYFVVVALMLPETQRKIVGNGSIPTTGVHKSLFDTLTRDRKERFDRGQEPRRDRKHHIPNPFKCIMILFSKGNFTVIMIGSITYMVKMTLQASLATQCIDVYGLDYLQAGLIYLPSGIGGAIASYAAEARLVGIYTLALLSAAGTVGYGVTLMKRTHIAVPLVMQFVSGAATSAIFTLCGTLLTDLNPHASATVQASYNLVRCLGAGAVIASQQPLTDAVGLGWCFGIFGLVMLATAPLATALKKWGPSWREKEISGTE